MHHKDLHSEITNKEIQSNEKKPTLNNNDKKRTFMYTLNCLQGLVTTGLVSLNCFCWTGDLLDNTLGIFHKEFDIQISSHHYKFLGLKLSPYAFGVGLMIGLLAGLSYAYYQFNLYNFHIGHIDKAHNKADFIQEEQKCNNPRKPKSCGSILLLCAFLASTIQFASLDFIFLIWNPHMALYLKIIIHICTFILGMICCYAQYRTWKNVTAPSSTKSNTSQKDNEKADEWTVLNAILSAVSTFFCALYSLPVLCGFSSPSHLSELFHQPFIFFIFAFALGISEGACHFATAKYHQATQAAKASPKNQNNSIKRWRIPLFILAALHFVGDVIEIVGGFNAFSEMIKNTSFIAKALDKHPIAIILLIVFIVIGALVATPKFVTSCDTLGLGIFNETFQKEISQHDASILNHSTAELCI